MNSKSTRRAMYMYGPSITGVYTEPHWVSALVFRMPFYAPSKKGPDYAKNLCRHNPLTPTAKKKRKKDLIMPNTMPSIMPSTAGVYKSLIGHLPLFFGCHFMLLLKKDLIMPKIMRRHNPLTPLVTLGG